MSASKPREFDDHVQAYLDRRLDARELSATADLIVAKLLRGDYRSVDELERSVAYHTEGKPWEQHELAGEVLRVRNCLPLGTDLSYFWSSND